MFVYKRYIYTLLFVCTFEGYKCWALQKYMNEGRDNQPGKSIGSCFLIHSVQRSVSKGVTGHLQQ